MKRLALLLCAALASTAALAQSSGGFGGFLRSITGSIGGGASEKQQPSRTSTIGIRGMDDEGATAAAAPASEDVKLLEGWSATRVEAERAAGKRGLTAKAAHYADAAPAAAGDAK